MSRHRTGAGALFLLLLVPGPVARGQERPAPSTALPGLSDVRRFQETALAPDGKRVAWVETFPAKDGATAPASAIFIADLGTKPGKAVRLTADEEPCAEHSLA